MELLKDYEKSVLYHLDKSNVIVNDLSCITIERVSHLEEVKKDQVKYFYMLARSGVWLEDSSNGGFVVHHNSELPLVVMVTSKQHLDPLLM